MTSAAFRYFIIISSTAALIIIAVVIYLITKARYKKEFLRRKQALQASHLDEISQYETQIHNLLNEIDSRKQNQKALEALVTDCEGFLGEHYCCRPVVDALFAYKQKLCSDSGVQLEISSCSLEHTDLTDEEYIGILGNLLDNAIEAAQKTSSPTVNLQSSIAGGQWILTITNSKPADEMPLETNMATTKADNANHGLGSRIVKKTVKKHNGVLEYKDHGESFKVTVVIPVTEQTTR